MPTRPAALLPTCFLLLLLSVLLVSQTAAADKSTPIAPGVTYTGELRLSAPQAGVSFTLPAGYQGGVPAGTEAFVMGTAGGSGRILMTADRTTAAEARATMAQMIDLGDGVRLLPQGALTDKRGTTATTIRGRYAVVGAAAGVGAEVTARVGRHGFGVAIIAVGPEQEMPALRAAVAKVGGSIAFKAPATAPAPAPAPAKGRGSNGSNGGNSAFALSGVRLLRYFHGSGYSEKTVVHLCSNGHFRRNFDASSSSVNGTGAAVAGSAGRYSVRGNQLTLSYHDGSQSVHTLALDGSKLMIDGQRWYREHQDCF